MFSVPLGIIFGADVNNEHLHALLSSTKHSSFSSQSPNTSESITYFCYNAPGEQLIIWSGITRSLIAAFLGNIVGAMFVALPALYFYLGDDNASRLEDAETGQIEPHLHASSSSNTSAEVKH